MATAAHSSSSSSSCQPPAPARIFNAVVALSLFCVALWLLLAAVNFSWHGWPGVAASVCAMTICWTGGCLSLSVLGFGSTPYHRLAAAMGGLLLRTVPAGAAVVAFSQRGGPLVEAGLMPVLVVSYLAVLVVETCLSVRLLSSVAQTRKAA